jgi:hypothetical protein
MTADSRTPPSDGLWPVAGSWEGYAVLSDCHGNSPGHRAVLEDNDRAGITNVLSLGDARAFRSPGRSQT